MKYINIQHRGIARVNPKKAPEIMDVMNAAILRTLLECSKPKTSGIIPMIPPAKAL